MDNRDPVPVIEFLVDNLVRVRWPDTRYYIKAREKLTILGHKFEDRGLAPETDQRPATERAMADAILAKIARRS